MKSLGVQCHKNKGRKVLIFNKGGEYHLNFSVNFEIS